MLKRKIKSARDFAKRSWATERVAVLSVFTIAFAVIFMVTYVAVAPRLEAAERRREAGRFNNMPTQYFLYDFNYLMNVLEENWPFFNLSASMSGVDVREAAEDFRVLLNNPYAKINSPYELLDLLYDNFIQRAGQTGRLFVMRQYQDYFHMLASARQTARHTGVALRDDGSLYATFNRTQSVIFYDALRNAVGGNLQSNSAEEMPEPVPVVQTDIIEYGRIAYVQVNRMIHLRDDFRPLRHRMRRYEESLSAFNNSIEGFEHLIIDLRGNPGGDTSHCYDSWRANLWNY